MLYWVYKNVDIPTPKMLSPSDRMIFTLQCHALTIAVLLNMIVVRAVMELSGAVQWLIDVSYIFLN